MAGIGFELKRVLRQGGIVRFIGVSLAGTAIVAGPWLLSVLGHFPHPALCAPCPAGGARAFLLHHRLQLCRYHWSCWAADCSMSSRARFRISSMRRRAGKRAAAHLSFLLVTVVHWPPSIARGRRHADEARKGIVAHPGAVRRVSAVCTLCRQRALNWVLLSFISLLRNPMRESFSPTSPDRSSPSSAPSSSGARLVDGRGASSGYAIGQCHDQCSFSTA
jgi:hypothetical protein